MIYSADLWPKRRFRKIIMNSWFDLDWWRNKRLKMQRSWSGILNYSMLFCRPSFLSSQYSAFLRGIKIFSSLILRSSLLAFISSVIPSFLNIKKSKWRKKKQISAIINLQINRREVKGWMQRKKLVYLQVEIKTFWKHLFLMRGTKQIWFQSSFFLNQWLE